MKRFSPILLFCIVSVVAWANPSAASGETPRREENSKPAQNVQQVQPAPAPLPTPAPPPPTTTTTLTPGAPANVASTQAANRAGGNAALLQGGGGFGLNTSIAHYLGTGTFADPRTASLFVGEFSVGPRYGFNIGRVKLNAAASWGMSWEYTLPDNETGRRFSFSNVGLSLSAPGNIEIPKVGIRVIPSVSLQLPTTPEAWKATLITTIGAGVAFQKQLWKFNFIGRISGSRSFHVSPENALRAQNDPNGTPLCISRAGDQQCSDKANNSAWALRYTLAATFLATEQLNFFVSWGMSHGWSYPNAQIDPLSSTAVDVNGNSVVSASARRRDSMSGDFGVGYSFADHWYVGLDIATTQAPTRYVENPDGSAGYVVNFPFWAGENTQNRQLTNGASSGTRLITNATTVNLTLSAFF